MNTPRRTRVMTFAGELARGLRAIAESSSGGAWAEYRDDPVAFCREVLGFTPWSEQRRVLEALAAHDWISVRSGHRVGKSTLAAAAAQWFYATRGAASRVILTAPKFQLVNEVVWREVRRLFLGAKRPLGGELAVLASTGLRANDGRQIIGVTATDAENFAGIAAPELFFIGDEASGISERVFEALLGNLAGGGKLLLLGNPTKASGFFFESHRSERFHRVHIPSTSSPNITGEQKVRGLATLEWCTDREQAWGGQTGALYRIRVLGEFVEGLEGRLFTPSMIIESEQAWASMASEGRLVVGVDPAGDGGDGDDSGFVARRGRKVVHVHARRGLSPEGHVAEVLGIISEHRGPSNEPATVVLDRDGPVGARVYGAMLSYLEQHHGAFIFIGIRGSEHAKRKPQEIDKVRDELWFNLLDAFRAGLAIPPHVQLEGDLASVRFDRLVNGRATILKKAVIRRELGRSPDLGDALALCAWQPVDHSAMIESQLRSGDVAIEDVWESAALRVFDPYGPSAFRPPRAPQGDDSDD